MGRSDIGWDIRHRAVPHASRAFRARRPGTVGAPSEPVAAGDLRLRDVPNVTQSSCSRKEVIR
jgi:hypothetical protein